MPMTSSIVSYRLPSPPQPRIQTSSSRSSQSLIFNPISRLAISKSSCTYGCSVPGNRSCSRHLSAGFQKRRISYTTKMNFVVYSSDQQGDRSSFGAVLASWKNWVIGAVVTVILPFLTNKCRPLLKWLKVIEAVEEKVENMAEDVEKVAEKVEEVAEEVVGKLPEGDRLRDAITSVENAAKETVRVADSVEELVEKVEKVEEKVEDSLSEQASHKSSGTADGKADGTEGGTAGGTAGGKADGTAGGTADGTVDPGQTV